MANDPINNIPDQKPYIGIGPFKLQIIQSFPFIEADFDAITNQQLLQKVVDYLNKIIQNNNAVTENTTSLYNAFVELENYVNNYFQNLDIQDEINKKLDDLVNDGTIPNILDKFVVDLQQQINYLNQNKQDKNALINMSNLAPDVKEALTGGSTAIVGNQSVYNTSIVNNAIEPEHIRFLNNEYYNINNPNYYNNNIYNQTSGIQQVSNSYCRSEIFPCELQDTFFMNTVGEIWWSLLDENNNWISSASSQEITITNENVKNICVNYANRMKGQITILKNRKNNYLTQKLKTIDFEVANNPADNFLIKVPTNLLIGNDIQKEHCNFITHNTNNLYDYRNFMYRKMFSEYGGNIINAPSGYGCTNLIPLGEYVPSETIFNQAPGDGFTFLFDENKKFIGYNITGRSGSFTIPNTHSNAKYFAKAILQNNYKNYYLIKGTSTLTNEYSLDPTINVNSSQSILYKKKIGFLGDSITNGFGATVPFRTLIQNATGCQAINYGINNSRISNTGTNTNPMCIRYNNMADDLDYICVMGGTNDIINNVPLGESMSTNTTTFYGALNTLIVGLINKYTSKKICFLSPLKILNNYNVTTYKNAIQERCNAYAIPMYDLQNNSGLNPDVPTILTSMFDNQGVHPNNQGNLMFYNKIQTFLESL